MRAFIPDRAELELIPDATEASEAAIADLNSASIFEAIRVRELALTPVTKAILQSPALLPLGNQRVTGREFRLCLQTDRYWPDASGRSAC